MMPLTAWVTSTSRLFALYCLLVIPQGHRAQNLKSLISLSRVLAAKPDTTAIGNVNIIKSSEDNNNSRTISLCYLPYLSEFSHDYKIWNRNGGYEGLAAISLALEHLNTGNGHIVPELNGINQSCPVRFFTNSFDTMGQQAAGLNHIIDLTDRGNTQQLVPCAIIGAARSTISIPTSIISSLRGFPQISPISTSNALDDQTQHKLFGRTIPNDDGTAIALVAKLTSWNINYIAILHTSDAYGNAFADGIRLVAQNKKLRIETVNINISPDDTAISQAIKELKKTQFTFFFVIIHSPEVFDNVMTEAYHQKIAGTGLHTWLYSDSVGDHMTRRSWAKGTPLERAYRGTGILAATGGILGTESFDKLRLSMQQLRKDEQDMLFLNAHLPKDYPDGKSVNQSEITSQNSYLSMPGMVAPFLYDAVVGLGLAACELASTMKKEVNFTGEELYQTFVNTTFQGTSGLVDIDPATGTRKPQSAFFSLTNFIDDEDYIYDSMDMPQVRFKGVFVDLFKSGEWTILQPYTFNDGTPNIPMDLSALVTNLDYITTNLEAIGFLLCGIIIGLATIFGGWTYRNRELPVVRASQPIFLYIISAGTLLMGASIIPFTISGLHTHHQRADAACMAFPWLLAIGFSLTFSALFTKTYRIKQIMKNAAKCKRIKLTARDVMKPMITLLVLNIIVLSVWTAIDPLRSKSTAVRWDDFGRDLEAYNVCSSDHLNIFIAILGVINLGSVSFSLVQAYQARNISTEFSESRYIFDVMTTFLYTTFLAVPIIILSLDQGNVKAYYFVVVGHISITNSSILFLIFLPKILAAMKTKGTETLSRSQWQTSRATEPSTETSEEDDGGIQIYSTSAKVELEVENQKLKRLCKTLSTRQGLDYNSAMTNSDDGLIEEKTRNNFV